MPIRQTYINGMIPSRQRATILSFDSMMSSSGGVWAQPVLGRVADDVWGYAASYLVAAGIPPSPFRSSPSRGARTRPPTRSSSPRRRPPSRPERQTRNERKRLFTRA